MAWATRQYSKEDVDAAGVTLIRKRTASRDARELDQALAIINNWRASHSFPLNTFQVTLRLKAREIDGEALVAQRLKRISSIHAKLRRFKWLNLSEMQDIGGCRAIVGSVGQVRRLANLYKKSHIKHKLDDEDDYMTNPKRSGYRSVHLIYRYYSDRKETYNGLKIEMQLRSKLQHAWATAVETVGAFTHQALKSSQGRKDWLRFFALMGTDIALREHTEPVPDTPIERRKLKKEIKEYVELLDVEGHLHGYSTALKETEAPGRNAHYFLLELDPNTKELNVRGYKFGELEKASEEYLEAERNAAERALGADAVLVSVESLEALRRAYPNYFLDTHTFVQAVRRAIG